MATILQLAVAALYLVGAAFNATYTLPRSDQLDGYAEGAWFGFLEDFMWDVFMPNGEIFMIGVVLFEVALGLLILGRGPGVDIGVAASVIWVLGLLPFLAWPYLLTNLLLAGMQGMLALRRYDTTIWSLLMTALRRTDPEGLDATKPG